MHLSSTSIDSIKNLINQTIEKLKNGSGESLVTDINFFPNPKTGVLAIMDDEDHILAQIEIEDWTNSEDDDEFFLSVGKYLMEILADFQANNKLEELNILKPYSFVLVDEDGESIEELLLVDDDILIVNDTLLQGLDQELDDFLSHLLEE